MLTGEPGPGASEPSGRSASLLDEVCDVALDARVVGTSLRRRLALRTGSSLLVLEGIPRATALRRVSYGSLRYRGRTLALSAVKVVVAIVCLRPFGALSLVG